MDNAGTKTRREILSQPEVWTTTLDVIHDRSHELKRIWQEQQFDSVVLTGCGSTYYLALTAASILQQRTGLICRGVPASELLLYPQLVYPSSGKTLLIAISRSGETTETLSACRAFLRDDRGTLLTISCYPDQPLATMGALNIVLLDAREESVVQTRAYTSMLLAIIATTAIWADQSEVLQRLEKVPAAGQELMDRYRDTMTTLGRDPEIESFYFLGSGPQYGLACEASLKMKEMSLTLSEPFHFLELRHGPKSIINPAMLVVGFHSLAHQSIEQDVMTEAKALGGKTLALGSSAADITIGHDHDEEVLSLLYLPLIQWLATERAIRKGIDPDHPKNLDTVVKLTMSE